MLWLLNFVLGFLVDALWVFYTKDTVADRAAMASLWSMLIATIGIIGWLNGSDHRELFVPYVLGLGTGTYVGLKVKKTSSR